MRKAIVGVAAAAAGLAAVRFGPALARRGMNKCHEIMGATQRGGGQGCACREDPLPAAGV